MVRHKGLMIILDGLGDHSCANLQGQTPLEAAATPNLDRLAHEGVTGLVDPLYAGIPVGTHTGTGVLLGLAPADAATRWSRINSRLSRELLPPSSTDASISNA